MSFFSWFRRRINLNDPSSWREIVDTTYAGKPVTAESAMCVAAFFGCVRLLSLTVGSLPFGLYEKQDDGGRKALIKHPLYRVLHDIPNVDQTSVEFWEGVASSICIWGNSFAEKLMNKNDVIGLRFLPAPLTSLERHPTTRRLTYYYSDRGKREEFPSEKILHIKGFGMGGDLGLSTLTYARQSIGLNIAGDQAAGQIFSEGLRQKGFFVMPSALTPEQRIQAEKQLVDRYSGPEAKKAGILEGGVKFEPTNMLPQDAELLLSRKLSIEDICRFLGTPPIMIGHAAEGQTMWGSGVEELILQWYMTGLRPILVRIERAIYRSCIPLADRETVYAEFNLDALFRANSKARAELWSNFAQNGIMTRNEIRAKENLPKMAGGDELTVQAALVPLRLLAQNTAARNQQQPDPSQNPPIPFRPRQAG